MKTYRFFGVLTAFLALITVVAQAEPKAGQPSSDYVIQSSSSLTNWTPLVTNTPVSTTFDFIDNSAGATNKRFYRVLLEP